MSPKKTHARVSIERLMTPSFGGRGFRSIIARLGGLAPERERRQDLCAEVDREDLQHRDWQRDRAARQRENEERNYLRRCVSEDVDDELADVVEDAPPGTDRRDDRREVVVGEHHRRRFACDLRSGRPIATPMSARLRAGASFDAVPGHRDDVALGANGVAMRSFASGATRAKIGSSFSLRSRSSSSSLMLSS